MKPLIKNTLSQASQVLQVISPFPGWSRHTDLTAGLADKMIIKGRHM